MVLTRKGKSNEGAKGATKVEGSLRVKSFKG